MALFEKVVDLGWKAAAKVTGANFEKQVLTGPRVNEELRPDLPDVPGIGVNIVMQTGESVFVENNQREVKRKLVR